MKKLNLSKCALAVSAVLAAGSAMADDQEELEELRQRLKTLEQRMEATAQQVDRAEPAGPSRTTIGGYGELHYNNLDNQLAGGDDKEVMDFHRFVLFFGHQFTPEIEFFSEVELEHSLSGDGEPGEVELEQAYVDFQVGEATNVKGGLFLMPVGILNETHEPPTFYGVERNPVEKHIVPSTWWEGGAMASGEIAPGLRYDAAVTSGLHTDDYDIRGGRQKAAKAKASDLAYTGRLQWKGVPGLELSASWSHQADVTQGDPGDVSADLLETHAIYQTGGFGLRALYATWDMDDNGTANGRDEQEGWYVEPSYRMTERFGVFARYNVWDEAAGSNTDTEYTQTDVGVNFWPHEDVVVKFDYQGQDAPDGSDEYDGFNLGIGYQF